MTGLVCHNNKHGHLVNHKKVTKIEERKDQFGKLALTARKHNFEQGQGTETYGMKRRKGTT